MKVVIVEDELNSAQYLGRVLTEVRPEAQIVTVLESVQQAVNWFSHRPEPDLILMDIELADGKSFEILANVKVNAPIIFTTAYEQYAIDAFKVQGIDYLLKPIAREDLEQALEKFDRMSGHKVAQPGIDELVRKLVPKVKNRCLVKIKDHYEFIDLKDVAYAFSESSVTFLYTFSGQKFIYNKTVEQLTAEVDPNLFFQINRSQLININNIKEIHPYFNQRQKLVLNEFRDEDEFIVSRHKLTTFKGWLDQ